MINKKYLDTKLAEIRKTPQILSCLSLSDMGICLKDGPFTTDVGIVTLHPTNGTHWVAYISQIFLIHAVFHYQTTYLGLL